MKQQRDTTFITLLVLGLIAVLVAAWFLLFNPALARWSEAKAAYEQAYSFNESLELQLIQKRGEHAKLSEYQAEIDAISEALPPYEDLATIRRELYSILASETVAVEMDVANPAVAVEPGVSLAIPAAAVGRESHVEGLAFQDLYQTEIQISLTGSYADIIAAIARLQLNEGRYYLVSDFSIQETDRELPDEPSTVDIVVHTFTLVDIESAIDPAHQPQDSTPTPPGLSNPRVPLLWPAD